MTTSNTTVLCIGAGAEQVHAMTIARNMGFNVLAVDKDPAAVGRSVPHHLAVIDIATEQAVVNFASDNKVSFVLPAPIGRFLTTVGAVNDALKLPGISRLSALICVDKAHSNRLLRSFGINMAQQRLVIDWQAERAEIFANCPLPCIVKPRFGSGSRGVRVCRSLQEVESAVHACAAFDTDILIEQLVLGREYGVDAATFAGRFQLLSIREKLTSAEPYRADVGYVTMPTEGPGLASSIAEALSSAVKQAGLANCLIHADVISDLAGNIFLIEFSGRPSGMMISSRILPLLHGVDIIQAAIEQLAGMSDFPRFDEQDITSVAMIYFPFSSGQVQRIGGAADARTLPGIVDVDLPIFIGQRLEKMTTCRDAIARGYVLATGVDSAEARDRAQLAIGCVMQETMIGEDTGYAYG